ncbi:MAG: hypothetical protein R3F43_03745 [bacterium]
MNFAEAVAWAPAGPGRWRGHIDPTWMQGRGAFEGLVGAVILRAMSTLVDRPPRTLTVHFCGPATGSWSWRCRWRRWAARWPSSAPG